MSRSYKKCPCVTDHGKHTYKDKRNANKKVRHTQDLPNGSAYKKVFCSYDICDWKWCNYSYKEVARHVLYRYAKGWIKKEDIMKEYYKYISK